MWVEIEGKPLEVYAQGELMEGGSEAWIASENGKVRLLADKRDLKLAKVGFILAVFRPMCSDMSRVYA